MQAEARATRKLVRDQRVSGLGDERSFYDAYVAEHGQFQESPPGWKAAILRWLPYASYREWSFWRRHLPRGGRWLDLGCARGRELFVDRAGVVVGADLALPALRECRYDLATQALTSVLPFADGAFDCVVSSHVLGHIPAEAKLATFEEIARVLRPGSQTLHVVEMDSTHPLVERAKRHPDLYETHFIEPDGHVGLEGVGVLLERFAAVGLTVREVIALDFGDWLPRVILKHFDNEYTSRDEFLASEVERARRIEQNPLRLALTEIRQGFDHWRDHKRIDPRLAPYAAIAARKQ